MNKLERDRLLTEAMDQYGDYLIRLAFAFVKDKTKAEDIVQETFIRYYITLESFENRSSVKTYLYRITVNECHHYFKSWTYRKTEISSFVSSLTVNKQTPEDEMLMQESKKHVAHMVDNLPIKYKEVVWLYYYAELSVNEIGDVLNCSTNTVKTRLAASNVIEGVLLY
ncbi:MAG: sigma-70 family RNA polymerase sigma factor [Paenisporosarcina sp.]